MSEPLAYLLTWTTYGSWLHGDARGSVDRFKATQGLPYHPPNPTWQRLSRRRMSGPEVALAPGQRAVVQGAIAGHCRYKGWSLLAMNARSHHVHVVLQAEGVGPDRVMNEMKAYATRALRQAGQMAARRVWTRGGSTRYLSTPLSVEAAVRYVQCQ